MNNADLIVSTLKAAGIRRGFGIPSGNVLPLMDAMRKGGVDFVLTAHEGSAGFAADVTGRMSGAPGLCIATLGPGATNLATGVGNAWLDRSPMIAITCNLVTEQLGRRIQMWIDHHALFAPITKASFRLEKGKIVETINEAVRIAMSEPRGPVHLDLPEASEVPQERRSLLPAPEGRPPNEVERRARDRADIEAALRLSRTMRGSLVLTALATLGSLVYVMAEGLRAAWGCSSPSAALSAWSWPSCCWSRRSL